MKFKLFTLFFIVAVLGNVNSQAQCDFKIEVSSKITNATGEVSARLTRASSYKCILYVYHNGEKLKEAEITGSSNSVKFDNLLVNRYYSMEFIFKKEEDLLCSGWVSDLIQIKE